MLQLQGTFSPNITCHTSPAGSTLKVLAHNYKSTVITVGHRFLLWIFNHKHIDSI